MPLRQAGVALSARTPRGVAAAAVGEVGLRVDARAAAARERAGAGARRGAAHHAGAPHAEHPRGAVVVGDALHASAGRTVAAPRQRDRAPPIDARVAEQRGAALVVAAAREAGVARGVAEASGGAGVARREAAHAAPGGRVAHGARGVARAVAVARAARRSVGRVRGVCDICGVCDVCCVGHVGVEVGRVGDVEVRRVGDVGDIGDVGCVVGEPSARPPTTGRPEHAESAMSVMSAEMRARGRFTTGLRGHGLNARRLRRYTRRRASRRAARAQGPPLVSPATCAVGAAPARPSIDATARGARNVVTSLPFRWHPASPTLR